MDLDIIAENLAELLTNTVNMTSLYYDIFINPNPMDVELQMYNDQNELVTIVVPNRAKDKQVAYSGEGSPEGKVVAPPGSTYVDMENAIVYYKMEGNDAFGWDAIIAQSTMEAYVVNYLEEKGYLTANEMDEYLAEKGYLTMDDKATTSEFGIVKPDGSTLDLTGESVLRVIGITNVNSASEEPLKVWTGTSDLYAEIEQKDAHTIYVLKDTGEILLGVDEVADVGFPSTNSQEWLLGTSGDTYEAPANGWVYLSKVADEDPSEITKRTIEISDEDTGIDLISTGYGEDVLTLLIPVSKGDTIEVNYDAVGNTNSFLFIYSMARRIGENSSESEPEVEEEVEEEVGE